MQNIFRQENIKVGLPTQSREAAIMATGKFLAELGYVDAPYIQTMLARDREVSVYMGAGLAIPHGTLAGKAFIKKNGIVILQYPEGIEFNGEKAKLLIGLAAQGNDHMEILQNVVNVFLDFSPEALEELFTTQDPAMIYQAFNSK